MASFIQCKNQTTQQDHFSDNRYITEQDPIPESSGKELVCSG